MMELAITLGGVAAIVAAGYGLWCLLDGAEGRLRKLLPGKKLAGVCSICGNERKDGVVDEMVKGDVRFYGRECYARQWSGD